MAASSISQDLRRTVERNDAILHPPHSGFTMGNSWRLRRFFIAMCVCLAGAPVLAASDDTYVATLHKKYTSRIEYKNSQAATFVKGFNINCKSEDGRYLPLINVLLAKLREADTGKVWLETIVDSRDGEVRIYDYLRNEKGRLTQPELTFEISKWGELRPVKVRTEALLNACFGSYGPIWAGAPRDTQATLPPAPNRETYRLVSTPPGFEQKAKSDPIGACAWKLAVLQLVPSAGREKASVEKEKYCSALSADELQKAESEASQTVERRKRASTESSSR